MSTATVQSVEFGLGRYEPTLRFFKADGLMNISWGEVPYDDEAHQKLTAALDSSGMHAWLLTLFSQNEHRLPPTSRLLGPSYGTWVDCPEDIGDMVVDILTIFTKHAMKQIIPTLGETDLDPYL